jgi:subtilisin family serine protease
MKRLRLIAVGLLWLVVPGGPVLHAQVSLPNVQVPGLPKVGGVLDDTLNRGTDRLDLQVLRTLRRARVRALIRNNPEIIEADPQGAPILRNEVVAFAPSQATLAGARTAGFSVARELRLEALDITVVVLRAPAGVSTRRALEMLRAADPQGSYDYNHVYLESGIVGSAQQPPEPVQASASSVAAASAAARIGLIDSGVDVTHPVFAATTIIREGCSGKSVAAAHGTAVASLIAGEWKQFRGAAVPATLYAADVYCGVPSGGSIDAIIGALGWMARERVPVVNMSLVGPPNALLENITRLMLTRGHVLVAAVGNDGPAAKPLYPAAYPGVIGVTAVDESRRVLLEACRGPQVDFAAPGSDMLAAAGDGAFSAVRGTSFAAPLVAALLAARLSAPDAAGAAEAARRLAASAVDLGSRGRDDTYGDGLVGESLRRQFAASTTKPNENK